MFKLNEKYTVSIIPELSDKGLSEIQSLLSENYDLILEVAMLENLELRNKNGKIAKRISKAIWIKNRVKLSSVIVSEIGNIANNNTMRGEFVFTISDDMDVFSLDTTGTMSTNENGTKSCFSEGGCYREHYEAMDDNEDSYAVRIWQNGQWIARSWLEELSDKLAVFNAYGLKLDQITQILGQGLKLDVVKADNINSDIYLNSDRVNLLSHDVKNTSYYSNIELEQLSTCEECGDRVHDDESYWANDSIYCESCYSDNFSYCESCSEAELAENGVYHDDRFYCEHCASEELTECEKCGDLHTNDEIFEHDYTDYCESCYSDNVSNCEKCNYDVLTDETTTINDCIVCDNCKNENYSECENCNELTENSELTNGVCYDCQD